MRIISFSEKWPKLHLELPVEKRPDFCTFRYWYWQLGWGVQVFYKNRSRIPGVREKLGEATIIKAEPRELDKFAAEKGWNDYPLVTDTEAQEDGFPNLDEMVKFMEKQYGGLDWYPVMNKLTLRWLAPTISTTEEGE
uniref:Uncharacterized protein n=1 Tax=viral metagenome TaxID=1070528 RepID=A0A6M3J2V5_9ZZZZ